MWSNRITDILFLFDIIVTFNAAYFDDDFMLVEDRGRITYEYFTGWFGLDLVCIIPFDLMFSGGEGANLARIARVGRINKVLKLLKLLRLAKMQKS